MSKKKNSKKVNAFVSWSDVEETKKGNFFDVYKRHRFPEREWDANRLIGKALKLMIHWIPVLKKGGGSSSYPVICPDFAENRDCPLCRVGLRRQTIYLTNAINREIQDNKPSKAKLPPKNMEFITPDSKYWTPVVVLQFPETVATKLKNLTLLNKVRNKKTGKVRTYDLSHPKYGIDILILFDPNQQGSGMYDIQKGERTPLTKEEKSYPVYDLTKVFDFVPSYEELVEALRKAYDNDLLDDDNCNLSAVRNLFFKPKRKGFDELEDEDYDENENLEDDDNEEDEYDDLDDNEDNENENLEDDELEDDEDENDNEDDDELEDDEDENLEDDELEDDEDDDNEEEEDEYDDLDDEEDELTLDEIMEEMDLKEILEFVKSNKRVEKEVKKRFKNKIPKNKKKLMNVLSSLDFIGIDDYGDLIVKK